MSDSISRTEPTRRAAAALDAAVGAGRDLGLTVTDATVLHDVFSVVVHLAPAPVVARIPTFLPPDETLDALAERQRSELDVTRWLDARGVPVLPPSPLVPCEPVRRDGFSMTFWQFVDQDHGAEPDYEARSERTADLHAALRDYPGPLTFLSAAQPGFVTAGLDVLGGRPDLLDPADLDRARREWRVLEPLVRSRTAFEARFPGIDLRPVHGDSPPANIYSGVGGDRFADFELITLGPVEWDVAGLGAGCETAYDRGARRLGSRPLDPAVLGFTNAVGMLRAIAVLSMAPELPAVVDFVGPAVDAWRTMPFAGGVPG
ncbi:aminoglycoside phosphotransferase family protein [Pseudonocardia nematodicida]|uniref:Aminoglycoside phosphotransferase family protein n=1 Tax=Pseudonocardia nematodicida TaxID=1206997 RepID=A0ABV1KEJ8_9PSEU